MDILWLVLIVAGLVVWQTQRGQIARLSARVAALEAAGLPVAAPAMLPAVEAGTDAAPARPAQPAGPLPPTSGTERDLERRFGQRWLVWIGALALALGGVFVVQYSIEQDLIGPAARIALGLLVAVLLVLAAEFLRKRPERLRLTSDQTALAAAALAAGGVAALFGVAWAAFALYALIPPDLALAAMAGAAAVALLLAWHHGPLLAIMALAFAYVTPVLVTVDAPDAGAFAAWLVGVQLVLALTLRFRPWTWLLSLDLLGLVPLGGLLMASSDAGTGWGPFVALAATGLPVWLAPASEGRTGLRGRLFALLGLQGRIWVGALLFAVASMIAIDSSALSPWPLPLLALVLVGAALVGRAPLHAAFAAGVVVVVIAGTQQLPPSGLVAADALVVGWRVLPPVYLPFARYFGLLALGFFTAGTLGAFRTQQSGGFAALAVTIPLALFVAAFIQIGSSVSAPRWVAGALLLAGLMLAAAERAARRGPERAPALAAYALGVVAAMALGLAMALETAWLTLALAVELLAVVLVHRLIPMPALARVAAVIAGIVVGRLIWQSGLPMTGDFAAPGVGNALWAYALPTLLLAASWLAGRKLDPAWTREVLLVTTTVGALVALMRCVSVLTGADGPDDLLEPAQLVAALALAATSLALRPPTRITRLGTMLAASGAFACFFAPILRILAGETLRVLDVPVLNPLLLLFVVPALATALVLWRRRDSLRPRATRLIGAGALLLLLAWPILEIRRSFTFSFLWGLPPVEPAENWLYSAWLVVAAVALLAAGLWTRQRDLRLAAMAVLVLAILKVFLVDLDDLQGLWRAAAFLGLGVTLVGVGLAYQRLFSDDRAKAAAG